MKISCGQWHRFAAAAALLAVVGLNAAEALANETGAQPHPSIDVVGNRRIDAETVRSYFRALPDGRFDDAVCGGQFSETRFRVRVGLQEFKHRAEDKTFWRG